MVWVTTLAEGLMAVPLKTISFGYEKLAWLKAFRVYPELTAQEKARLVK